MSWRVRVHAWLAAVVAGGILLSTTAAAWPAAPQDLTRLRAAVLSGTGRPGDLIAELKTVLAEHPESAEAHLLLGLAYQLAGADMLPSTIAEFRQALALDPTLVAGRYYLARAYLDLRRPERAREELETALAAMTSRPADFLIALADAERQAGNPTRALELAREVPAADPNAPQARYRAAQALLALDRDDEAIAELEQLVAADIAPPEVTASLGSAYLDAGRWAEAIPLLEQTIAIVPNRPDFHVMLARALRESGQLAAADARLALALPDNAPREASEFYETVAADIDLERGLISLAQDRLDDADASLARALALRPDHGPTHRALAELRLRQNRRPDAAAHAARARAAGTTLPPELAALLDGP